MAGFAIFPHEENRVIILLKWTERFILHTVLPGRIVATASWVRIAAGLRA